MLPRSVKRLCTCAQLVSRSTLYLAANPAYRSPGYRSNSTDAAGAPLPWFVDPATAPSSASPSPQQPKLATAPVPTPPPSHLPIQLHSLHSHLSISPFLDKDSIMYINSREADPDSWTDWIVIATLRQGRERGIRGAVEGVRAHLASNPIDLSPAPASTPFAPPSAAPLITGLPTPPSKHARARSKGGAPSRTEQASGWAMLDAGKTVIHVMTLEARENWGIEQMWETIKKSNKRSTASARLNESEEGVYEELSEAELEAVRRRERNNPTSV